MAGKVISPVLPVYLVAGDDEYNKDKKVKELVKKTLPAENRELNYLDLDCSGTKDFVFDLDSAVRTVPFLADRRVIVIREFERLAKEPAKALLAYVEAPSDLTVLILVTKDVAKSDFEKGALYKNICAFSQASVYYRLWPNELPGEIKRKFAGLGKSISQEACEIIVERVGNNMRDLDSEIEKINLYIGQKKNVEAGDVLFLVSGLDVKSVFDLINAVSGKKLTEALKILNDIFYMDLHAGPLVVGAIYAHFKNVWTARALMRAGVSENALTGRLRVHPYFVRGLINEAKVMDEKLLGKYFNALAKADDEIKGGAGSGKPVQIMEKMLYAMLRK